MTKQIDITGHVYGRLTVVERAPHITRPSGIFTAWSCVCSCGTEIVVSTGGLRSGNSKSCGCLQKDSAAAYQFKHGHSPHGRPTRAYTSWRGMFNRCYNSKNRQFHDYGGRGITVCDSWHEFANFIADMGDPPEGMSLDRINNDSGYEPSNCRWATRSSQNRNTRRNRFITHDGMTLTLAEWSERLNVKPGTLHFRLKYTNSLLLKSK